VTSTALLLPDQVDSRAMTPHIPSTLVTLLTLVTFSATLSAQQPVLPGQPTLPGWNDSSQPVPNRNGIYTLRTGAQLVVQDITDTNGKLVTGLKPKDFHIFENGLQQTIKNFEEHAPVDPSLTEERQAELDHALPPNTSTNYKAFSGGTLRSHFINA
jgi:hypothetical protein